VAGQGCHGTKVQCHAVRASTPVSSLFEPGRFLFQSEEKNVPEWIKAIDQWIDTAETRRMTEMNEKFKDL